MIRHARQGYEADYEEAQEDWNYGYEDTEYYVEDSDYVGLRGS